MKRQAHDFARLWPALGLAVLLALSGLGAAGWGSRESTRAGQTQSQSAARLQQIKARLQEAREQAAGLRQFRLRLQELAQQGFLTPENRLEWVELLRQSRTRLAIPVLHYEIEPQRPLENGSPHFRVSRMNLHLGLDHEMELESFLQPLFAYGKALILIRACDLGRAANPDPPLRPGPNIEVDCQLDWITAELPGASPP
ncbi:MAG: hypothetical protein WBI41_11155 [Azovibrio sp.]|uniref:hypothetical protein n=1 Tax=Azovibrio sp. TaxID=1872673 RepID=UPI003C73A3BD